MYGVFICNFFARNFGYARIFWVQSSNWRFEVTYIDVNEHFSVHIDEQCLDPCTLSNGFDSFSLSFAWTEVMSVS